MRLPTLVLSFLKSRTGSRSIEFPSFLLILSIFLLPTSPFFWSSFPQSVLGLFRIEMYRPYLTRALVPYRSPPTGLVVMDSFWTGCFCLPDRFGLNAFPYPYCLPPCQWNFHNKKTTDRLNGRNTSPSLPLALGLSSLSAFPSIRYRNGCC